jgi:hypothetical protein
MRGRILRQRSTGAEVVFDDDLLNEPVSDV